MALRVCLDCGTSAFIEEDLDNFVSNHKMKYNKLNMCKPCQSIRMEKIRKKPHIIKSTRVSRRKYSDKVRLRALESISNPPRCKRCGDTDTRILVYDHIHENGSEDRHLNQIMLALKILGMSEKKRLETFQLLCRNCNWIKQLERYDREFKERQEI